MSRGLNVLILGPYPENPERIVGGVEAVNNALVAALAAHPDVNQITVGVTCRRHQARPARRINEKVSVRTIPLPFVSGDSVIHSAQALPAVRHLINTIKPDVVHAHGIDRQGDIATQLGMPSVVTVHGLVHMEARLGAKGLPGKLKVMVFDAMVKRVLQRANVVISISEYDATSLSNLVGGRRISISNPIGAEFFAPFPEPQLHPTLFFAGVMRPRKNVTGLVNAFAQVRNAIPNARLVIAGPMPEPDYAAQVRGLVETHKLQDAVSFLGHVSNEQLLDAMRQSAALALFSFEETSPTVIAQALAVGRPVVASNVGGIPEMVQEGYTGFLVEPADEATLARRLIQLLSDLPQSRVMGIQGRQFAQQRYEPSAVAQQTVEAYRTAINAHR